MRVAILTLLLAGCAGAKCPKPPLCPALPPIGASEVLKDYTIKIGHMYNECAQIVGGDEK
jgi:hypothetical protein